MRAPLAQDGNGFADPVVSFSSEGIYRSIFYMKLDFTLDGSTDLITLRDTTCDLNPRATGCSVFAGPSDLSDFVGVSNEFGAFPSSSGGESTGAHGVPEMVLSPLTGGSRTFTEEDTYGTQTMQLADFDNDGNMDILYGTDANEAARVSLARPYDKTTIPITKADPDSDAGSVTNENDLSGLSTDVQISLKNIENGMLNFLDAMLQHAPTVIQHNTLELNNPNSPGGTEDSYAYVNRGPTTQNNVVNPSDNSNSHERTDYDEQTVPRVYPGKPNDAHTHTYVTNGQMDSTANTPYDVPRDVPNYADDSLTANVGGAQCRAPSESVLPMTVSVQIDFPTVRPFRSLLFPSASPFLFLQTRFNLVLSSRLFAKQVPCVEPDFPNCSKQTNTQTHSTHSTRYSF